MPSVVPRYSINSDLGDSLFLCTYAPHSNTHKCEISGCVLYMSSKGMCHWRRHTGVLLYRWTACSTANSQYDWGRQAWWCIASALSMQVQLNCSAQPFCWGVFGVLCMTLILLSLSVFKNSLDLYSPPVSDIQCFIIALNWFLTVARECFNAAMAEALLCNKTIQENNM